jgi:hypothetical protein
MGKLVTTLTNGSNVTHIHNGIDHFFCGRADDIDVVDDVVHKNPSCKHCIKVISNSVAIAKKYNIK